MSPFRERPVAALINGGCRLNLRHGPIDLIVEAEGSGAEISQAYNQATAAFENVLTDLVGELDLLRTPVTDTTPVPRGLIARRMRHAATAHQDCFVTPMVAVAGAVADHILGAMMEGCSLRRAFVNNGGDIAMHLANGETANIAICANPESGALAGTARIHAADRINGVATSGWRGRSHSLGIADAVTVLAHDAVTADAAATLIANEVTVDGSLNVERAPASDLSPDSDLGGRLVTVSVGDLTGREVGQALDRGAESAVAMTNRGLIAAAFLCLAGQLRTVGNRQLMLAERAPGYEPGRQLEAANA